MFCEVIKNCNLKSHLYSVIIVASKKKFLHCLAVCNNFIAMLLTLILVQQGYAV